MLTVQPTYQASRSAADLNGSLQCSHQPGANMPAATVCPMQDMLAMRKTVGSLTGRLLVNGQPATASFIRHSSYVPHVSCHNTGLRASWLYGARPLRLPPRQVKRASHSCRTSFCLQCSSCWSFIDEPVSSVMLPPLQEDNFIPTMSSRETLAFYARVVLGKPWSRASRRERVAQVLDAVGLSKSANTPVSNRLGGHVPSVPHADLLLMLLVVIS